MLSWLAQNGSTILGLVLALAVFALLVLVAWRAGRAAGRAGGAAFSVSGLVAAMRAREARVLSAGFGSTLKRLCGALPGSGWRYAVPWVLLLGGGGGGRSTLAAAIGLHRPVSLPPDLEQAERGCVWHVFESGMLLEPAESVLWGDSAAGATPAGWQRLLGLLRRYRPERGIDGVVVTVSAAELLPAEGNTDSERARMLRERLRELQHYLGLRVPVYLLVTKCDLVPGFAAFWRPLAETRGRQIFGWSNDETIETGYGVHLIPRAFDELGRGLHGLLLNQAVDNNSIADLAFLFPAEFQKLAGPLGLYADRLFHIDGFQEAHFFRGVYFTGDVPARSEAAVPATVDAASGPGPIIDQVTPRPLFLTELFADKVFREATLTRAVRGGVMAHDRAARWRWGGLAVAAVILLAGTWASYQAVETSIEKVTPPVHRIVMNERKASAERNIDQLLSPVLEAFRIVSNRGFIEPFLPETWFSSIEGKVKDALVEGFEQVLLDPMARELRARAETLIKRNTELLTAEPRPDMFEALRTYITGLNELAAMAVRYNQAEKLSADELSQLIQPLLRFDVGDVLRDDLKLYKEVMARVKVIRLTFVPQAVPATKVFGRLVRAAAETIEADGLLVRQFQALAEALRATESMRFSDPLAAAGQLKALDKGLRQAQAVLDAPDLGWRFVLHPENDAYWTGKMGAIRQNPFLGAVAADDMLDVMTGKVAGLRSALLALRISGAGPVLVADERADGRLRLAPPLEALAKALPPVLAYDFLTDPGRQPVPPVPRANLVMWAPEPLERAVAYEKSFKDMEAGPLAAVPESLRPLIKAVAGRALQGAMLSAVADAEVLEPRGEDFRQFDDDDGLLREATQFGRAAVPLGKVLEALQARGFDQALATVSGIVGPHALAMLEQADHLAEESGAWMPVDGFRNWDGTLPMNFEGYQVLSEAELDQYLKGLVTRFDWLAGSVARPVTATLQSGALPAQVRRNPRVVRWLRIIEDIERYKAGNPASTLAALERFIRADLAAVKPGACPEGVGMTAPTVDYFVQKLQTVQRQALSRCQQVAGGTFKADFERIAADFNSTLAGHYPFAGGSAADTPEVAPEAVAAFFERFSPTVEAAVRRGLGTPAAGTAAALQFVDRLAAVREFMAPLAAPAGAAVGAFEVEAEFRVNRPRETGGNQIIEWMLALGDQQLQRGGEAKVAKWHPGETVTMRLRWAKNAPVAPMAAVGPTGASGAGFIDAERALVVAYPGQWGLLRLLQNHRAPAADLPGLVDRAPTTLKFSADTGSVPIADAPEPVVPPLVAAPLTGRTGVFVRVSVMAALADGKSRRSLALPVFPFTAPRLESSSRLEPRSQVEIGR